MAALLRYSHINQYTYSLGLFMLVGPNVYEIGVNHVLYYG